MEKPKLVISFSGGKDSALALHRIMQENNYVIDSLLTTVTNDYSRTSMHGVREVLLDAQGESLGLPIRKVRLPKAASNDIYQEKMGAAVEKMKADGVTHIMFGDIYLEDVKAYREKSMEGTGITPIFPIWGEPTDKLMREFLDVGFKTVLTCVDSDQLNPEFVGHVINKEFIKELPTEVDICGENGEFHTFTFDGPIFSKPILFEVAESVKISEDPFTGKDRFYFKDLIPV